MNIDHLRRLRASSRYTTKMVPRPVDHLRRLGKSSLNLTKMTKIAKTICEDDYPKPSYTSKMTKMITL
jgi:hypothetical protein